MERENGKRGCHRERTQWKEIAVVDERGRKRRKKNENRNAYIEEGGKGSSGRGEGREGDLTFTMMENGGR